MGIDPPTTGAAVIRGHAAPAWPPRPAGTGRRLRHPLGPVQQIVDGGSRDRHGARHVAGVIVSTAGLDDGWYVIGSVFCSGCCWPTWGPPASRKCSRRSTWSTTSSGGPHRHRCARWIDQPGRGRQRGGHPRCHGPRRVDRADELTIRCSWRIVVSSVLRRPYPEAPVSSLSSSGSGRLSPTSRRSTATRRNATDVRFWPVPDGWKLPGGFEVQWLAAAT